MEVNGERKKLAEEHELRVLMTEEPDSLPREDERDIETVEPSPEGITQDVDSPKPEEESSDQSTTERRRIYWPPTP